MDITTSHNIISADVRTGSCLLLPVEDSECGVTRLPGTEWALVGTDNMRNWTHTGSCN